MSDQKLEAMAHEAGLAKQPYGSEGLWLSGTTELARFAELVRSDERQAFDAAVHERVGLHLASSLQAVRVRAIVRSGADDAQIGATVRELVSASLLPVDDVLASVRADALEDAAKIVGSNADTCHEGGLARDVLESNAAAIRALKNPT